jgi:hypothetical protein
MLRKWIYRDYYHANLTDTETKHISSHAGRKDIHIMILCMKLMSSLSNKNAHIDHCLDILRQAAICRPDPSLTTFRWSMNDTRPMFDTRLPRRTCVDFDAFMESVQDRKVDNEDIRNLKNPLLSDS